MTFENIIIELALIYAGTAVLATFFLFLKQPIIISYILLGIIIGPYGFGLIKQAGHIENISHVGIILLLFLIGLNLHPNKLVTLFKKTSIVTTTTCFVFSLASSLVVYLFGYPLLDSIIIGLALMFSSTVIGLKLIPTTDLHTRHIGEMMISVLLFQDILAILIILFIKGETAADFHIVFFILILKGIVLSAFSYFMVKYVILPLFRKFDVIQEYIFIIALGWCLLVAGMAKYSGLSYEIGAFISGVALAISPVALVISEKLKSLREFFLILFFFAIGAQFDLLTYKHVLLESMVLATLLLIVKPIVFRKAFRLSKENDKISSELAVRLGQSSEFSLIIAYIAYENMVISEESSYLIQLTVIITFIVSTYVISGKYKTPISVNQRKRRD